MIHCVRGQDEETEMPGGARSALLIATTKMTKTSSASASAIDEYRRSSVVMSPMGMA